MAYVSYPEYNLSLKRLSFHDMNLADCQSEVLFLLKNLTLQEITFSFCRLFEKCPAQFLPEMVAAMKGNSTLKGLRLPGNRLGRDHTLERREGGREERTRPKDLETLGVKELTSPLRRLRLQFEY